ncbi:AmmeMemoRadiSam system protein B [Methanolinea mesophila]|uniref:AmmeMemoRadiSam system protein B n=1 Tax=Methanolinea mesophila TaxID=547055 RepID=UPI001AE22868|nr:AmmeMemoRadiSam system protein B [Methanolinea mesophila]MBP1929439.1 AmmeMemoRadiSam system protein B [Methanolinea mesophila]
MKIRASMLAGTWYPRDPSHLEQLLEKYFRGKEPGVKALGVVSPHAGYPYSGEVAAWAFSAIDPDFSGTIVVVGPSHRGYRTSVSRVPWETPLGILDNDPGFSEALDLVQDEVSHQEPENSLEVQMPFIKFRFPRARVVPIMMGDQDPSHAEELAGIILEAVKRTGREVRIVASSDFSHYVPETQAREQDLYAIEALTTLDVPEFYRRIASRGVSACGYGPIATMCHVCRGLGASMGRLIRYGTSGDVTGDPTVVGYAAIAVI